ncbi:MAG: S8 family peptidase [Flavobacteriales bacterium]|nr:S8 family peptidase [Flavobacteriales bacterium]
MKLSVFFLMFCSVLTFSAQEDDKIQAERTLLWHLQSPTDELSGIQAKSAYDFLQSKKSVPIIVAVIDSGTETAHPELSSMIWVNADEIAGNGIDDDKNGYIDDVNGWSFIGGAQGDVEHDNLEFTRVFKDLKSRFEGKSKVQINKSEMADFEKYERFVKEYDQRLSKAKEEQMGFDQFMAVYKMADMTAKKTLNKETYTIDDVYGMSADDEYSAAIREILIYALEEDLPSQIDEIRSHFTDQFEYSYNLNFDPRYLVGDNYLDPNEKFYGNNHNDGPKAEHGTHVAGIIGALNNGIEAEGVAHNVKIMPIRCVPNGDERDKDVANSIRYAVDNGAKIINMSFGKSYSPFKGVVDEAIQYAELKNVLLIHASGNDSKNNDVSKNFPTAFYDNGKKCSTWIEVGASDYLIFDLSADFSNYGKKKVDLFAPGVDIYSTYTNQSYKKESGTSMAAPVVSGVAAELWSYYPELTAKEVKAILEKSSVKYKNTKVGAPGNPEKKVTFGSLSKTGGVVNLYNAVLLAEKMK